MKMLFRGKNGVLKLKILIISPENFFFPVKMPFCTFEIFAIDAVIAVDLFFTSDR